MTGVIPGPDPGACPDCGRWRRAGMIHTCKPQPVFLLDAETLTPQAMVQPCPARVEGPFLGSDATHLRCAGLDGHDGAHYFHVEWRDSATHQANASDEEGSA